MSWHESSNVWMSRISDRVAWIFQHENGANRFTFRGNQRVHSEAFIFCKTCDVVALQLPSVCMLTHVAHVRGPPRRAHSLAFPWVMSAPNLSYLVRSRYMYSSTSFFLSALKHDAYQSPLGRSLNGQLSQCKALSMQWLWDFMRCFVMISLVYICIQFSDMTEYSSLW